MLWKAGAMMSKGCVFALTSNSDANQNKAIETLIDGMTTWSSTGATVWVPWYRAHLAKAHAEVGQFDEAWHDIREAMTAIESSKETWWEAEVNRIVGEIARRSPGVDALDAEKQFERALNIARQQQAKSWELRAAMSLARLWRDQGKVQQARELLAPVYGWFTEGFDTRDLKEAKALLEELAS
jgi:predicted ATPase